MPASINIIKGSNGEASLCDRCAVGSRIDDSQEEFYENTLPDGIPTLRHKREEHRCFRLSKPTIQWDDVSPEYLSLKMSSTAGCELCTLIRGGLLRRNLDFHGPVTITCSYAWGGRFWNRNYEDEENGLSHLLCEVFDAKCESLPEREPLAYVAFPIFTNGNILEWLRTDDLISQDPWDPRNIEWIKEDLSNCEANCGHDTSQSDFIPTRLIDVGEDETTGLRLVMGQSLSDGMSSSGDINYATLSYCWGPAQDAAQQLKTTRTNFHSFCEKIPEDQVTPVIKDAIRVCRSLGIKYLWIDSLCIIQGNNEDWHNENVQMGLVYYYSYLTICPLSSHSCMESFLSPRHPGVDIHFQSAVHEHIRGSLTLYECHSDTGGFTSTWGTSLRSPLFRDRDRSTWTKRGWTFQEENFASRILFFGKSMLHFVCENALYSETYYKETGAGILSGFRQYLDGETFEDRSEMSERYAANLWRNMVAVSGRKYTYDTDFFPSIAGIARARSDILEDTYMAGMWKQNLHVELLWEMEGHLQSLDALLEVIYHPSPYIAPSWSWASRFQASFEFIGPYCYIPPETQSESAGVNAVLCYESAPSHVQSEISVVEYSATFVGHNPYGRIKDAYLILRGKLAPLPSDVTVVPGLGSGRHFGYLADKLGTVTFDWTVSERTVQEARNLVVLLTASCCQATSNAELVFHANPDEDHAATFAERPPPVGLGETGDEYRARNEPSACFSCAKEAGGRNGWGIVLHPAQIPDAYVRIGICRLFGGSRALDIFRDEVEREVKII